MKKFTKIIALVLAAACIFGCFAACAKNEPEDTKAGDFEYIQNKGELIIGITLFAPMDYYADDNPNELTGFEVEFGKAVCEKLGVTPVFQEISWEAKESELKSKNIDCIWNGLTITPERQEAMSFSTPYMANKQILIVKKENADKYTTAEAMKGLNIVAEKESAGEEVILGDAFFKEANYTAVDTMAKAMMEVKSGTADAAVIDYVTGIGSLGEGTDYEDLVMVESASFADEQYGIAFRQGSDITDEVNKAITELVNDGTLKKIADKYKLGDQLIAK